MNASRYRLVYRPRNADGFRGGPGNPVSHGDIALLLRHAFLRRNAVRCEQQIGDLWLVVRHPALEQTR